ncbi:unnamed protein product [Victoria cruziana]
MSFHLLCGLSLPSRDLVRLGTKSLSSKAIKIRLGAGMEPKGEHFPEYLPEHGMSTELHEVCQVENNSPISLFTRIWQSPFPFTAIIPIQRDLLREEDHWRISDEPMRERRLRQ